MTDRTIVYTDGACSGNPGPGGWAWVVPDGPYASGFEADTTNQRMELAAALDALRSIDGTVTLVSDSTYVVNCFRDGWWEGWLARDWRTSAKKPVANRDLWEPLVELARGRDVEWQWVKGHSGDEWNDVADALAVEAVAHGAGRVGSGRPEALGPPDSPRPSSPPAGGVAGRLARPEGHLVVVLGLRPDGLGGYDDTTVQANVRRRLGEILAAKARITPDLVVLSGLRLGAEQLGAEAALDHDIPMIAVLPYPDPDVPWPSEARQRFAGLCRQAREVRVLQKKAPADRKAAGAALGRRDGWLARTVDEAIVVWDGDDAAVGALVAKLERTLGDDVWIVDPAR